MARLASLFFIICVCALSGCTWHEARPIPLLRTALNIQPTAPPPGTPGFEAEMDQLTNSCLTTDNRVHLLNNGNETFPAMLAAINQAQTRISLESYDWTPDEIGDRFAEALIAARQRGVTIRFIMDRLGSESASKKSLQSLRDAGVEIRIFNPIGSWTLLRMNNRDHRKIMIVDGTIAFLGGLNLSKPYDGDGIDGWRDTAMQVQGPVAHQAELVFAENWQQAGGGWLGRDLPLVGTGWLKRAIDTPLMALTGQKTFRPPLATDMPRSGTAAVRIVRSSPTWIDSYTLNMYLLAINSAQERIYISNAYFLPPEIVMRALRNAAARGVDVRIITQGETDHPLIRDLSVGYFASLIKSGVRVYQWPHMLLHAKTIVVDGVWSSVGSCNIDGRSFYMNYEANFAVTDPTFAAHMEEAFMNDLRESNEYTLADEAQRSLWHRSRQIMLLPLEGQF